MGKLISKENKKIFTTPLSVDNPILVQVLGICSALAVTSQLKPAIVMGLAVTIITAFSNVIISLIRHTIPNRIRMRCGNIFHYCYYPFVGYSIMHPYIF